MEPFGVSVLVAEAFVSNTIDVQQQMWKKSYTRFLLHKIYYDPKAKEHNVQTRRITLISCHYLILPFRTLME